MATCKDLRDQIDRLLKERDQASTEVSGDEGDLKELEADVHHINHALIAQAQATLAADRAKLQQINDQLAAALSAFYEQGCPIQPQRILDIRFENPDQLKDVDALFAQGVALGQQDPSTILGGTFPSRDAQQEWKQTLPADLTNTAAHEEDYEGDNLVGASGWALVPRFSGADVPFTHPFDLDYEFYVALDQPPDDPKRYTFLLTPADQSCAEEDFNEAVSQAANTKDAHGQPLIPFGPDGLPNLLGIEIDGGLVPTQFTNMLAGGLDVGDRVAVFGRWIVDCGHQLPITRCDGTDIHPGLTAFRTEIHPPLLMAAARVTDGSQALPAALNARQLTRLIVTSRPFLVGQRFTTDTGTIYEDDQPDDGPFFPHMIREVVKANDTLLGIPTASVQVEAHPKIKSYPFKGSYEMHLIVRPPAAAGGLGNLGGGAVAQGQLAVAFQFTVRSGCTVQVKPMDGEAGAIDITIKLDQSTYIPPQLPTRNERTWSRDELGQLNPAAADAYISAEEWSAGIHALYPQLGSVVGAGVSTLILERGIKTDEYDTRGMTATNLLDSSRAVGAPVNNIPNTDISSQMAALVQERDQAETEVSSDEGDLQELVADVHHANSLLIAKARATLAADKEKLKQLNDQIAALLASMRGVVLNDDQPYPIYGWLEIGYLQPVVEQ